MKRFLNSRSSELFLVGLLFLVVGVGWLFYETWVVALVMALVGLAMVCGFSITARLANLGGVLCAVAFMLAAFLADDMAYDQVILYAALAAAIACFFGWLLMSESPAHSRTHKAGEPQ